APAEAMHSALERVAGLRIKLRELPPDHFGFMGDVRRILALFEAGPRFLRELVDAEPLLEGDIRRVLYFLLLTRSVDLGVPSAPRLGSAEAAFAPPPPARLPTRPPAPPPPSGRDAPASAPPVRRDSPASIPPAVVRSVSIRDELRRLSEKPPRTHYEVLGIAE